MDWLLGADTVYTLTLDRGWGAGLYTQLSRYFSELSLETLGGVASTKLILALALSQSPVSRTFLLPHGKTLGDVEREGSLFLSSVTREKYVVTIPISLIKLLNNLLHLEGEGSLFPESLLFFPTPSRPWRWQDFEQLYLQFQVLLKNSLLRVDDRRLASAQRDVAVLNSKVTKDPTSETWELLRLAQSHLASLEHQLSLGHSVGELFRGASGSSDILGLHLKLSPAVSVQEQHQFLTSTRSVASVVEQIPCNTGTSSPFDAVFECAQGNALIDHRFACHSIPSDQPPIYFFIQAKQSLLPSQGELKTSSVTAWYDQCMDAMEKFTSHYRVVCVYLSNRRLVDDLHGEMTLFEQCPLLLLITQDNLREFLGLFAGRGLLNT